MCPFASNSVSGRSEGAVIEVRHLKKKFCRSLKRAMFYTGVDLAKGVCGLPTRRTLRKGEFWALDDVSIDIRQGESVGLIGPNGSGKSTLLRVLNGIISPNSGYAKLTGHVAALIQVAAGFHPNLTGRENIYISGALRGIPRAEIDRRFDDIVDFAEVREFIDMPVVHYSSGMYVRLGYAIASHIDPDILLLDEVLAVGDIGFRHKCFDHLMRKIDAGTTMVFVTHSMEALVRVCSRAVVLSKGRIVYDGDVDGAVAVYQRELWEDRVRMDSVRIADPRIELSTITVSATNGDEIRSAEDVEIAMEFNITEDVGPFSVSVKVESITFGIVARLDSDEDGVAIAGARGRRRAKLTVRRIPLLPGHYMLNVSVTSQRTGRLLLRHVGAARMEISDRGKVKRTGRRLLALDEEWQISRIPDE